MSFSAIPPVPPGGSDWQFRFSTAVKQNLEVLTGQRAGGSTSSAALLASKADIPRAPDAQMQQVQSTGSGASLAALQADHILLIVDVQTLANDVAALRATVNALINSLNS